MLDAVTGPVASEPPVSCVIGAWLVKVRYPVRAVTAELVAMAEHGLLTIKVGAEGYSLRVLAEAGTLSRDQRAILDSLLLGQRHRHRPAGLVVDKTAGAAKPARARRHPPGSRNCAWCCWPSRISRAFPARRRRGGRGLTDHCGVPVLQRRVRLLRRRPLFDGRDLTEVPAPAGYLA